MKRILGIALIIGIGLVFSGCSTKLLEPTHKKYAETNKYKYAVIPMTNSINSSKSSFHVDYNGGGGRRISKAMNPSSIIEGLLLKKGLTSVNQITDDIKDRTLIVKYGQSGRREVFSGYTLEVTMKMLDAKTKKSIFMCTAEGYGSTEVDDIRQAITRCLSGF